MFYNVAVGANNLYYNDIVTGQSVKSTARLINTSRSEGPRRSLNLSDYKKRRGLI